MRPCLAGIAREHYAGIVIAIGIEHAAARLTNSGWEPSLLDARPGLAAVRRAIDAAPTRLRNFPDRGPTMQAVAKKNIGYFPTDVRICKL